MQPEELNRIFAENLKKRRKELGYTQAKLANEVGCHTPHINDLEKGKRNPSLGTLAKIAEALKTSPVTLIVQ